MKYDQPYRKNIQDPPSFILPDIPGPFRMPGNFVAGFVLVPVEHLEQGGSSTIQANGAPDVSTRCSEPYALLKLQQPQRPGARLIGRQDRRLMAVLVADAAGYCRLMNADETTTVNRLNAYKSLMFSVIESHKGRVVDSVGDNLMASFTSVVNAVQCAVTMQTRIGMENSSLHETEQMNFRMGIHLGDVICQDGYLYGNTINIAARLQSIAEPGGIRISRAVYDLVAYKLDLTYCNLGERYVKNIPQPVTVYRVGSR